MFTGHETYIQQIQQTKLLYTIKQSATFHNYNFLIFKTTCLQNIFQLKSTLVNHFKSGNQKVI